MTRAEAIERWKQSGGCANACGHWAGSVPIRHPRCRHLPLTECATHTWRLPDRKAVR